MKVNDEGHIEYSVRVGSDPEIMSIIKNCKSNDQILHFHITLICKKIILIPYSLLLGLSVVNLIVVLQQLVHDCVNYTISQMYQL